MTNELKKALKTAIKKKESKRRREANQNDSEEDNLATILATCIALVGTARVYPRHPIGLDMPDSFADYAPSMLSSLHDTSANMGWDTDAALLLLAYVTMCYGSMTLRRLLGLFPRYKGLMEAALLLVVWVRVWFEVSAVFTF